MWNEPNQEILSKVPRLYETENIPLQEKPICLHFFIGGCDWYIAEYDGDDIFWGFAILGGDTLNAEWGYIPFSELKSISAHGVEIDCEIGWESKRAGGVEKIRQCWCHSHW